MSSISTISFSDSAFTSRYMIAAVLQFQFHKALCIEAGEYGPKQPGKLLSECCLYNSKAAGNLLRFVSFPIHEDASKFAE